MRTLPLFAIVLTGCLRTTSFICSDDASCGTNARCEPSTSYCSVPDSVCNGNRYVSSAGSYAGECVDQTGSGGIDANLVDASPDGPSRCPADFVTLPGLTTPGHHVYKPLEPDDFDHQEVQVCDQISHAYLAIPNSAAEIAAIAAAQAPPVWVGIRRITIGDASSFWTSQNELATSQNTFTPWQGSGPMEGNGKDCVEIVSSTEVQTETCGMHRPAFCECEP